MQTDSGKLDLLWGADEIAKVINVTPRQAFYMLKTGSLPARKLGGRWVIERRKLVEFFTGAAA